MTDDRCGGNPVNRFCDGCEDCGDATTGQTIAIEALIGAMKADALARFESCEHVDYMGDHEAAVSYAIAPSMKALGDALTSIRNATDLIGKLNLRIALLEQLNAAAVVEHDAAMDGTDPDAIDYGFAPVQRQYTPPPTVQEAAEAEAPWRAMMRDRAADDAGTSDTLLPPAPESSDAAIDHDRTTKDPS